MIVFNDGSVQCGSNVFCFRIAEMEVIKERDADQPGQEWERITRLCEFNPKTGKNTKDVSRLRSILLQLKQTPLVRSA